MSTGMSPKDAQETIKFQNEYIMQLSKEKCALQAKIDSLMLEYCPEEMEQEQFERWRESQSVSPCKVTGEGLDCLLNLNTVIREIYGDDYSVKPNQHCYWDSDYQCWTEDDNHYRNRLKSQTIFVSSVNPPVVPDYKEYIKVKYE